MLVLTQTTDNLQVVLGGAITTNQLQCMASWRDVNTTDYTPGRSLTNTNNTTDVNIVPSPASSTQRVVDYISIFNRDTVPQTVTIKLDANGTEYILWQASLSPGERVEYQEGSGFKVYNNFGAEKVQQIAGSIVSGSNWVNVTLGSDVVNNNGTANTMQDVTGLSFNVVAGNKYQFVFDVTYAVNATTTGSRWAVTGPSSTYFQYWNEWTLAATTRTLGSYIAGDLPAASTASSPYLVNKARVEGAIQPSANGTVQLRFASEVSSAAVTALGGLSTLDYRQLA